MIFNLQNYTKLLTLDFIVWYKEDKCNKKEVAKSRILMLAIGEKDGEVTFSPIELLFDLHRILTYTDNSRVSNGGHLLE